MAVVLGRVDMPVEQIPILRVAEVSSEPPKDSEPAVSASEELETLPKPRPAMPPRDLSRNFELGILSVTLIVVLILSIVLYHELRQQTALNLAMNDQAKLHFAIQRTSSMIERFNSDQMIKAKQITDSWILSGESLHSLMDRTVNPHHNKSETEMWRSEKIDAEKAARAEETLRNIRVFTNFFQELGTAMKYKTLHEQYAWEVFGPLVKRYGEDLHPFVEETRERHRPTMYQDFLWLVDRMQELEEQYGSKP